MRHEAIRNLYQSVVSIDDTAGAFDANGNQVTIDEQAVQAEISRLQAAYDAQAYARSRAAEYPDFKDYLDGVVKGDAAQIQAYVDACQAVKAKYPKPSE